MYSNKHLYYSIVNPNTGKQVKINSSKGKKIVKNYLSIINSTGGSNYNITTINEIAQKFSNIKSIDIQNFLSSLDKKSKNSSIDAFEKIIKWVSDKEGIKIKEYINPDTFLNIFKNYQTGGSEMSNYDRNRERGRDLPAPASQPRRFSSSEEMHYEHLRNFRRDTERNNAADARKYKIAAIGAILLFILWYWNN